MYQKTIQLPNGPHSKPLSKGSRPLIALALSLILVVIVACGYCIPIESFATDACGPGSGQNASYQLILGQKKEYDRTVNQLKHAVFNCPNEATDPQDGSPKNYLRLYVL